MSISGSEPAEELVDEQEELIRAAIEAQHVGLPRFRSDLGSPAAAKDVRARYFRPRHSAAPTGLLRRAALLQMQADEKGKHVVPVGGESKATGTHKDRPYRVLDLHHLTKSGRQLVVDRALKTEDQDNEDFLQRYAERVKRCLPCCTLPPVLPC